jgi:hypothetical protein
VINEVVLKNREFDNGRNHPYYIMVVDRLKVDNNSILPNVEEMVRIYEGVFFTNETLCVAFQTLLKEYPRVDFGRPISFISCVHKDEELPETLMSCNFITPHGLHVLTYVIQKNQNMGVVVDTIASIFNEAKNT